MNVLPSVAAAYLKKQKRHTALTETGIILSVILMTVVFIGVSTVLTTIKNIRKYTDGTYDVIFNDLSKDEAITISNLDIFEKSYRYSISSYTDATGAELTGEYEVVHYIADKDGKLISDTFLRLTNGNVYMLPTGMTELLSGRLPEKDGEITLSRSDCEEFGNISVGDTVSFARYECVSLENESYADNRTETVTAAGYAVPQKLSSRYRISEGKIISFTVVGISEKYSIIPFSDTQMKSFIPEKDKLLLDFNAEQYDFYWNLHYAFADKQLEIDDFDFALNQEYLNSINKGVTAKQYNTVMYMLIYLAMLFIMFFVRMGIDNSFEISSHERIRQYGVLRAVGASKKQTLGLFAFEALFLSLFGVPVGIALGYGAAYGVYSAIGSVKQLDALSSEYSLRSMMEFSAPPWVIISSAVIGVFWVLISAVGTGVRVNKFSPVEAMRAASKGTRVRKTERKAKEGRGGIEWLIAFRSTRRNNKRFIITLVAMAISVVMYAGFSYAVYVVDKKLADDYSASLKPYDYEIALMDPEMDVTPARVREMNASGHFKDVQYDSFLLFIVKSDENTNGNEGITGQYYLYVHPINEGTYRTLTGRDDYTDFENSYGIILNNSIYDGNEMYDLYSVIPQTVIASAYADYSSYTPIELPVYGTFNTDMKMYSSEGRAVGCMSEKVYEEITGAIGLDTEAVYFGDIDGVREFLYKRTIYANAADGRYDEAREWLVRHYLDFYTDNYSQKNTSYAILALVKIGGYFVIGLFTLIAAVNIINIISTNILNRTAEIGMLRACGMSSKQIYKMVFSETVLYSGIASISAALSIEGIIGVIYLPFVLHLGGIFTLSDMPVTLSFTDPVPYILIGAAGAFAVGAAAAIPAAGRIIKVPIVDAIESAE